MKPVPLLYSSVWLLTEDMVSPAMHSLLKSISTCSSTGTDSAAACHDQCFACADQAPDVLQLQGQGCLRLLTALTLYCLQQVSQHEKAKARGCTWCRWQESAMCGGTVSSAQPR